MPQKDSSSCSSSSTRCVTRVTNPLANELFPPPIFNGVRVAQSLVFFVVFCRLFVLVSFFELPPLITHVVLQTFLNIMTSSGGLLEISMFQIYNPHNPATSKS